jgi:hypothetical protein
MTTLDELDTAVQELRIETHKSAFIKTLGHIVTRLGEIPDAMAGGFTADDMIRLRDLAAETIEAVEHRIDAGGDDEDVQQHLAGTVYEIGRRMETIETRFKN